MKQKQNEIIIRQFTKEDMPLLGELYEAVTANNVIFWWVGEESNWINVFVAFEKEKIIAKGQVEIVSILTNNQPNDSKNTIFINLKSISETENDYELLDKLYDHLFKRAQQLKSSIQNHYGTLLCVGNQSFEIANNEFFMRKGFSYLNSLYSMEHKFDQPIAEIALQGDVSFSYWKMETIEEVQQYLAIDSEIWPEAPIGLNRLQGNMNNELWTSMVIRENDTIIAGLMVWKDEEEGIIEDVFVREPWRQKGYAKYLLVQALHYIKNSNLHCASLTVYTTNKSALTLYESVGFIVTSTELRYGMELR